MRLFVAVNFESRIRDLVASAIDSFPVHDPPWRWTRPETWHLTLKFLGETPESDAVPISQCLEEVAARWTAFPLSVTGFGGFPNLRNPRVLFYNVEQGAGEIGRLAADTDRVLHDVLGIPVEKKRFHAHVTVARVKTRLPRMVADKLHTVPALEGAIQTVSGFDLMKSELRRDGARYQRLKGFALPSAS